MKLRTDHLVIGSGIAGLTYAVKMAEALPDRHISIVTKANEAESNTKYAQGGVAVVWDREKDSFNKHIADTLRAGDGHCDPMVVAMVVNEGPDRLHELMNWGAQFDIDDGGSLNLGREGGHTEYRIVHHKDITGHEIEMALLRRIDQLPNITLFDHHFAIDLITEHHFENDLPNEIGCYGAYVMDQVTGEIKVFEASTTLLATGGVGQVYGHTTNPAIATGDGVAMAYRAKARIADMEFMQFHPTALLDGAEKQSFLISEAVRGFGAFLRNKHGERFMLRYDERGELASRDIVARGIDRELKRSGEECVYLDCTHLNAAEFEAHFPNIKQKCLEHRIDPQTDWIPVVPASHYLCGGIDVDQHGRTSIHNLYACGECSRTGLHGANRLASNSLLEALVYAHRIFAWQRYQSLSEVPRSIPEWNDEGTVINSENIVVKHNVKRLQALMRDYVGIVRSHKRLALASKNLQTIYREVETLYRESRLNPELCELRNMVNVAHLIICQSSRQDENRGGFYNKDLDSSRRMKKHDTMAERKAMDCEQREELILA
ncbi:L-aspartate oxidase [Robertkochia sediminum]|uniref:L-aspartate oxidase n=1 Tax=Robertkochia sediminum TaxID=2785326 RepID=UPI001932C9C5|nr:L-aspartate oxidase [Robertkochia sediminum]MBL7472325.1 L-aspartate oxidase [Robertkochia sediminum]